MNARTEFFGVIPDMSNADYHAALGVNNSAISSMNKSPAHCYGLHIAPDRPRRESTPAMRAGTLAHCAILEPDAMPGRYAVKPSGVDLRTTAGKEWAACHAGLTVITEDQMDTAKAQRAAVLAVPELASLLQLGAAERSAFWRDSSTGLICKCRPDWVHPLPDGRVILLDVKTTADASPDAFSRTVWTYGYHRQAAWYSQGWAAATGVEVAGFVFAVVCGEYPAIAAAYALDDESLAQGTEEANELLALYADCLHSGAWPGYGEGVQLISLPAWARRSVEIEVGYV